MGKRSNVLIALGLALFVLGVAATVLIVRNDDETDAADPGRQIVPVVVATGDISAGMTGEEILAAGLVEATEVRLTQKNAAAFAAPDQLRGRIASGSVSEGSQVLTTSFTGSAPSADTRSVAIPEGHEGLALQLGFLRAGARYVGIGDRVNVYAVKANVQPPQVKRVLADVEVLDVDRTRLNVSANAAQQQQQGTNAAAQPAATNPVTYLLAVTPEEAERIIFLTENEFLYLTLASEDQPPALTPGRDYANVLQ